MKLRLHLLFAAAILSPAVRAEAARPWEDLVHLANLPALRSGEQVLLRSSFCPGGCRFDRTSEGDTRFLRVENGEAVIFDEAGAGAIARIWMTMGSGVSEPIDPSVRVRFRLDGESVPRLDLPLASLFRGDVAPFFAPLVADRLTSSGGNVSYVPIAYRKGCVVSLVGAERVRIWFQVTFHRLASADGVSSFTGQEDLSAWRERLERAGASPWPADGVRRARRIEIAAGGSQEVFSASGAGTLREIRLRPDASAPEAAAAAAQVDLKITADGKVRVEMPLADFFAAPTSAASAGVRITQRTVLLGEDAGGFLYSFYPMPFRTGLSVELVSRSSRSLRIDTRFEHSPRPPAADHGHFEARLRVASPSPIGRDLVLADIAGSGKWVGLAARVASVGNLSREILEGDERVFVDSALTPAHYGTGVEDLFNGGFYFDRGPFRAPLHGASEHFVSPRTEDVTAMLRLMLSDAVPFANRLRVGLEGGPTGNLPMRVRAVTYVYVDPRPRLALADRLVVGDPASRSAHDHRTATPLRCDSFRSAFESEPPVERDAISCVADPGGDGVSRFTLRRRDAKGRKDGPLRLRREVDAGAGGPMTDVWVNGEFAGTFPYLPANPGRRFHETDLDLPPALGRGQRGLAIEIRPRTPSAGGSVADRIGEISYELWTKAPPE